jgi:hypothetical protein
LLAHGATFNRYPHCPPPVEALRPSISPRLEHDCPARSHLEAGARPPSISTRLGYDYPVWSPQKLGLFRPRSPPGWGTTAQLDPISKLGLDRPRTSPGWGTTTLSGHRRSWGTPALDLSLGVGSRQLHLLILRTPYNTINCLTK